MTVDQSSPTEQVDTTHEDGPLITVVITTYNRPSYLRNAVRSVLAQTYSPIELVIVDDHSDTPARDALCDVSLEQFHAVNYIRHEQNRGANAARNTGIKAASGEYIAFLDDDDRWAATKITRQVEEFEKDDDIGVTYTGLVTVNIEDAGEVIPPEIETNLTKALLCRNVIGTLSAVMVRTDVARQVPFDEEFPSWADLEWYVNLSTVTMFRRIPEPLVIYEYSSHNRLSEDFGKKQAAYERFVTEFDDLAGQYGYLFRRKMRGWAAYRLGSTALNLHRYDQARRLLANAVRWYPLEGLFLKYFIATAGGRYTHGLARGVKRIVAVAHRS